MNIDILSKNVIEDIALNQSIKKYKEKVLKGKKYLRIKRIMDIVFSIIGFVVLLPVFIIIGLVIKIDSKGPIFYKHTRVGKNGKMIKILKFRTMVKNADELMNKFTPEQMKEYKENYKVTNDPRITKVGKFLRRTSLDELPQLLNIIQGDLSIIGPRPVIGEELKMYGEKAAEFLSITPGLTGYWASNGRSNITYEERMRMELFYVNSVSFSLDFKILLKTIVSVLKCDGAK